MDLKIKLDFNAEKKHSVRYDAEDADAAISSVYISKKHLPTPAPKSVTVTITE
ncbi:MAG: hypothetical protein JWN75_1236 [Candidatus Saccharibacteria bacterium]|nr:hypothetical protein [Candidatus Saccharibacteria bacterium]